MLNDPIADFLTRLRNAGSVKKATSTMPSSKMKVALSQVLKDQGYIKNFEVVDLGNNTKELSVELKTYQGAPVIEGIKRISKGSCRVYVRADEIPAVRSGLGISILSTSQGLMTGRQAREKGIGGELLCKVW